MLFAIATSFTLKAQFIEDALRYSQNNGTYTVRAGALGTAFHGLSDDIGAMMYNPAGLSLLTKSEFTLGLGFAANNTSALFMGANETFKSNNAYFNNIGLVVPINMGDRNASFGIGYFMETNFDNNISFSGINAKSSFVDWQAKNGPGNETGSYADNLAYHLWLAGDDLKTPIVGGNQQIAFIQEKGGLHSITTGFAMELSKYISAGFTISGKWGRFKYHNKFEEAIVVPNKYTDSSTKQFVYDSLTKKTDTILNQCDFNNMTYESDLEQNIGGISGSIGIMAKLNKFFRFGVSIKFPSYYSVDEVFSESASATFDSPHFKLGKSEELRKS
ncbi:MAG: hypothetical protein Q8M94_20720, partial [Ignavibacteria bacterium]|nr:hypothetical protein [Ignavibacteria bacterium]